MSDTPEALDQAARETAAAFQARALTADPTTPELLFHEARTHYGWQYRDVSEDTLKAFYEIAKMGPTSITDSPCAWSSSALMRPRTG